MFRRVRRGTLASSTRDRGFAIVKPCSPPETIALSLSLSLSLSLCLCVCALCFVCCLLPTEATGTKLGLRWSDFPEKMA